MTIREAKQLVELYIPLLLMSRRGKQAFNIFVGKLGRSYVFGNRKLTDKELVMWVTWVEQVFIPMNDQMVKLLANKADLIDQPTPRSFLHLIDHTVSMRMELERWVREGGEWRHFSNFPEELEQDILQQIGHLSLETGWGPLPT